MKLSTLAKLAQNALEASGDMEALMEVPQDELKIDDCKVVNCQHDGKKYFFVVAEGCEKEPE